MAWGYGANRHTARHHRFVGDRDPRAFLRLPATEAKLRGRGVIHVGDTAAEFGAFMASEYALYRSVIAEAGIKAP